jgi:L-alanine-DL-glutamate epimerase-like enolase superfamily enzyme
LKISAHAELWPAARPFRTAGHEWTRFDAVVVEVAHAGLTGRGEALGVDYLGETADSMTAQIEWLAGRLPTHFGRRELQSLLPPGGARNALDCALWDLEAKSDGQGIWKLTGVRARPLETVYTIGLETTARSMAEHAAAASAHSLLKVKLDGDAPLERMRAIRRVRPDARIVVDVNGGWTLDQLRSLSAEFVQLGIEMIEQPLPRGADEQLESFRSPITLCADESCLHAGELEQAARRYQMVNIKLDKSGGLTHALELVDAARRLGLAVMTGCMGGTSLAVAPAFVVGCVSDLVDIDGPLLLRQDRLPGLRFEGSCVDIPDAAVWG